FECGRVDFAGHDGGARFVVGDMDLADAAAGAGGQHPDVVGDLHQADGNGLEGAVGFHDGVVGGEGFEFIGGGYKGEAGQFRDLFCDVVRVAGRGVDAGSY